MRQPSTRISTASGSMRGRLREDVPAHRARHAETARSVAFRVMARRALPLALLATIAIGGCSYGTSADITADQRQARLQLIDATRGFDDHELARLWRGLYPSDFLPNEDDSPKEDRDHKQPPVTQRIRDLVGQAGCDTVDPPR